MDFHSLDISVKWANNVHIFVVQYELKVKVKIARLCPALCDPMDYIVHGIL